MLVCLKCNYKLEGDVPTNNLIKIRVKGLSYETLLGRSFIFKVSTAQVENISKLG